MTKESVNDFYSRKHGKEYGTESVYLNPSPEHYHQKILGRIGSNNVILDVGCASGYLGAAAKKNGSIVYGIEGPNSKARDGHIETIINTSEFNKS